MLIYFAAPAFNDQHLKLNFDKDKPDSMEMWGGVRCDEAHRVSISLCRTVLLLVVEFISG
jgi:hypothetical protein